MTSIVDDVEFIGARLKELEAEKAHDQTESGDKKADAANDYLCQMYGYPYPYPYQAPATDAA